jgi:hypothetical protein
MNFFQEILDDINKSMSLKFIVITGSNLDASQVIAVAKFGALVKLDDSKKCCVEAAVNWISAALAQGQCIYGVNTGIYIHIYTFAIEVYFNLK